MYKLLVLKRSGSETLSAIRSSIPSELWGQTNSNDVNNYWFTQAAVNKFLTQKFGSQRVETFVNVGNTITVSLENYEAMIVLRNNHFVLLFNKNNRWILVDSLNNGQNTPIVQEITISSAQQILTK